MVAQSAGVKISATSTERAIEETIVIEKLAIDHAGRTAKKRPWAARHGR